MQFRDFENFIINENGTIFSKYAKRNIAVSLYKKNKQGKRVLYPRVNMKNKHWCLARVIAECYVPNPDNKPHVNHIDGNRLNNHFKNLEWVTHEENILHRDLNGLNPSRESHGNSVATEEVVTKIREMRKEGYTYPQISKEVGLKESTCGAIGRGQNW